MNSAYAIVQTEFGTFMVGYTWGGGKLKRNELVKRELSGTLKEMSKSQALSSVTVSALTDKCGFSRGTFYYHFIDIYDLIN